MDKDRIIAFRLPAEEFRELKALAKRNKVTMTTLIRDALRVNTWRMELRRNIGYHKAVIRSLSEIEKRMGKTHKVTRRIISDT